MALDQFSDRTQLKNSDIHERDLELMSELVVELRSALGISFDELERSHSVGRDALMRLRSAWSNFEMREITLSLARYFDAI